ncbi:MAG: GDP-L-fucose synthase family protein [Fimbriimonadaceae bacterium]
MKRGDRVFVAGHRGLAGSAITARLEADGYEVVKRNRSELDLADQAAVRRFLAEVRPSTVIVAAATVGGIHANRTRPADFICDNVIIEHNLVWGSHVTDVQELMFLASSCMYPRVTPQPISEDALLSARLEPTNAPYAIAKIAGVSMCESLQRQYGRNYFTGVPPNLYGPNDNFDLQEAHAFAALLRKIHEATERGGPVEVWGSGSPKREFLSSADMADACVFLLERGGIQGFINIGTGESISIRDLAEKMQRILGHTGELVWNASMPDGFPEKTLDVTRLFALGWRPKTTLDDGIAEAHAWYASMVGSGTVRCGSH